MTGLAQAHQPVVDEDALQLRADGPMHQRGGDARVHAAYLYLASKAVVNLKTGGKSSITFENIDNPTNPKGANNLGHLSDYVLGQRNQQQVKDHEGQGHACVLHGMHGSAM